MEYVNLLIGRVGGFPVLAGVLVSYSVMRYGSYNFFLSARCVSSV